MTAQRSVGKFCSVVVATLSGAFDSVATLPSAKLGDGAECYCLANKKIYRYDASATLTSTLSPNYITAATGGGAWVMVDAGDSSASQIYGTSALASASAVATVANTWQYMDAGVGFYSQDSAITSPLWTLATATGNLTYNGATGKKFNVTINLSLVSSLSTPAFNLDLDFVENGALVGGTTATFSSSTAGFTVGPFSTTRCYISYTVGFAATSAAIYSAIFRPVSGNVGNVQINRFKMNVSAL